MDSDKEASGPPGGGVETEDIEGLQLGLVDWLSNPGLPDLASGKQPGMSLVEYLRATEDVVPNENNGARNIHCLNNMLACW